jgi:hypothetical protein
MRFQSALILFAVLIAVVSANAQSVTATLRGTVHDPAGAVIPGATVRATNTEKGIERTVTTNEKGDYVITQLPAQTYSISISMSGFQTQTHDRFVLQVSQEARLDATLSVGELTTDIVVSEGAPLIQSENASVSAILDEQKIKELPLNSRNFWQLAQLDPNVSAPTTNDSLLTRGGFVVAGVASSANNYLLDGADDNDWTTGQPTVRPSPDAIREFRIQTALAPAEFGRRAGGQIELTTKSGTNNWHGTSFLFYRNAKLNARNYFTAITPAGQSNQFGGSFGGPISKDKTFFFVAYEGTFVSADPSVALTFPATQQIAALQSGDFSYLLQGSRPIQLKDPITGVNYPSNKIPVSPQSKFLAQYFPTPTVPGFVTNNYTNDINNVQRNNQVSARVDRVISPKHNISGVYTTLFGRDTGTSGDFVATTTTPGFESVGPHKYQHITLTDSYVISPTLVNEFRVGFNRMAAGYYNQDMTLGNIVQQLGLPQGPNALQAYNVEKCGVDTCSPGGVPQISISGYSTIGTGNNPQWRGDNTVHLAEDLTWIRGNHTVKFGGDHVNVFKHSYFISNGRGNFSFASNAAGVTSGDFFADFALGYFASLSFGSGNTQQYPRQLSSSAYIQDAWKVSSALTLNYGLRYDYFNPHTEKYDHMSYFDPVDSTLHRGNDGAIIALDNSTGLLRQVGNGAKFNTTYARTPKNFAPRFGFDYRIGGRTDTVLRGGYGIFYNLLNISTWNSANGLGAPFLLSKSFITAKNAPLTWATPFAATVPTNSIAITTIDPHLQRPYTQEWSFGIQHQIGNDMLIEATYQGSHSVHYNNTHAINNPSLQTRLANPAAAINALRPFNTIGSQSLWGAISVLDAGAGARYNSLTLRVERRYHAGLSFNAYMVYAKSLDNSASPQDPTNPHADWGPSDFDQKLRSVTTAIYELPFGNGRRWLNSGSLAGAVVGGWKLTGIATFQSGRPFTATTNDALASNTGASDRAFVVPGEDPNASVTCNGAKTHTPQVWFNSCAFRANDPRNASTTSTTVFSYGTAGRNSLRGPGLQNIDFGLSREIALRNEKVIQARVEVFNMFNHPNFAVPAANYSSPTTVGLVSSTLGSTLSTATGAYRQLQFGLRYAF